MRTADEIDRLLKEGEDELRQLEIRRSDLLALVARLTQEKASLAHSLEHESETPTASAATNQSSQEDKIALFRGLFRGREDVYPRRFESQKTGKTGYQPVCRNEWVKGICGKPKVKCDDCAFRQLLPVADDVIRNHLLGVDPQSGSARDFTIGVYPLLLDETCWFLAADFDKDAWKEDAKAFVQTCELFDVPVALERSRSGNGGHCWIFFGEPVHASVARRMGIFLLSQTMERRPEIGLDSYDRLFPSQDTLPKGGFGNLIALPLQKKPRELGNSVFVDANLVPYTDQWAYLAAVRRIRCTEIEALLSGSEAQDEFLGIRIPVTDENEDRPWTAPTSGQRRDPPVVGPLPAQIDLVLSNQIYIPKEGVTPSLRNRLIRVAAFQNREFYHAQAMRLSTYGKPRVISCCEDFPKYLGLPRGCLDELVQLLNSLQIKVQMADERLSGTPIDVQFCGALRPEQQQAANALLQHDIGVLSASTGFGKTVIAAYLIAQRRVNTLVVVHRRQLLDQWVEALGRFLGLSVSEVGQIGGGKRKPTMRVDVSMIQSLSENGIADDIVGEYGHLIVDECHHVSAVSFERVVSRSKAKYVTGLSATVARKDGHQPIIFMQCGPIRHRVDDRKQAEQRPFEHQVIIRPTSLHLPQELAQEKSPSIQEIYATLARDADRNRLILEDVIAAVKANRSPVLLTERREHLEALADQLSQRVDNVIVMSGGMGKKQRQHLTERMAAIPMDQPRVIIATGRYLGEGFDDQRLDTLFLALPISWRGTLAQYAGRLHRLSASKKAVIIYDYVDFEVPMLARMYAKRRTGYKAMGYEIGSGDKKDRPDQLKLTDL